MQTTHKIAGASADGYAAYLTSTSDRGDYYTGEGQEEEGGGLAVVKPSRWHGSPRMLAELQLSPQAPVERDQLASLMRGVSPVDGHELRPTGGNGARVACGVHKLDRARRRRLFGVSRDRSVAGSVDQRRAGAGVVAVHPVGAFDGARVVVLSLV